MKAFTPYIKAEQIEETKAELKLTVKALRDSKERIEKYRGLTEDILKHNELILKRNELVDLIDELKDAGRCK